MRYANTGDIEGVLRHLLGPRRHCTLHDGYRTDSDKSRTQPDLEVVEVVLERAARRGEVEGVRRQLWCNSFPATRVTKHDEEQKQHADHDEDHLHDVGCRNRLQAAKHRVNDDDCRTAQNSIHGRLPGHGLKHHAERKQHTTQPEYAGNNIDEHRQHACQIANSRLVKIDMRKAPRAAIRTREEKPRNQEGYARDQWVAKNLQRVAGIRGGSGTHHWAGTKPRCYDGDRANGQRHVAARDREISHG